MGMTNRVGMKTEGSLENYWNEYLTHPFHHPVQRISAVNGILLSHKKEWNLVICNNMDGTGGYYAKWNKSDRERQIPYDFTHIWNLKKTKQNKWTNIKKKRKKQSCRYREQTSSYKM